jgi:hypothetical protein
MISVEQDLDLIQMVADARYGGDPSAMQTDLEELVFAVEQEQFGSHSFRKVGNNCIVHYTNDQAMAACESNPIGMRGVLVLDRDTRLEASATLVGSSFLHTFVDTGSSVYHSDLAFSVVRRSDISRSIISSCMGPVRGIADSMIDGSRIDNSAIREATIVDSAVFDSVIKKRPLSGKHIRSENPVDDPSAQQVLANCGITPRSTAKQ